MIRTTVEARGIDDIAARIRRLGNNAKDFRRPNAAIAKEIVLRNRQRLARGVDVHGRTLASRLAKKLGLVPLGGGDGLFARSIRTRVSADGIDLYSNFVGADVAYEGKTITPRTAQWLAVPLVDPDEAARYRDSFFLRVNGKLFLAAREKTGRNRSKLRFLIYLTKRIRYPKNEWLGYSADDLTMSTDRYADHLDTFAA